MYVKLQMSNGKRGEIILIYGHKTCIIIYRVFTDYTKDIIILQWKQIKDIIMVPRWKFKSKLLKDTKTVLLQKEGTSMAKTFQSR